MDNQDHSQTGDGYGIGTDACFETGSGYGIGAAVCFGVVGGPAEHEKLWRKHQIET